MLSVKQCDIKYHFLSLWYDSTWDWTLVSWAIGEHSTHKSNGPVVHSKVGDHSWEWPGGSLFNYYYTVVGEIATYFPGLFHFTLDIYFIMLSVKQGDIKYHFLCLWYDSTWDSLIEYEEFSNRSIWPINGTLTGTPLQVRVDLRVMAMKGYSPDPVVTPLLEGYLIPLQGSQSASSTEWRGSDWFMPLSKNLHIAWSEYRQA